jgi:hypothetical protein
VTAPLTVADLGKDQLAALAREYLLAGQMIDRAGMPLVIPMGIDVMEAVAIEEWMGASPVYTKRMQQLLGFGDGTVECSMKGMQLDIGAPPEFMDFRFEVQDDRHGTFHLDHCGALMDVEPMGEDYVVAMCHHIEDPTFDATGWATDPRLRMRPVHRPPRVPADRHPHCAWTVEIDPDAEPTPTPERSLRIGATQAGRLPLPQVDQPEGDGRADYAGPLDADLRMEDFDSSVLRALLDEIALQGHLLVLSFASTVVERVDRDMLLTMLGKQFAGTAGVAAIRLKEALHLGEDAWDVATLFALHPAFRPSAYVDWSVHLEGAEVHLELGDCAALHEDGEQSWLTALAAGQDRAISSIAMGIDCRWQASADGANRWVVRRGDEPAPEFDEVTLVKFSSGATFRFGR